MFCEDTLSKNSKPWSTVKTLALRDSILSTCSTRLASCTDDLLAAKVKSKLATCFDLVSKGAKYPKFCRISFFKGPQNQSKGRSVENEGMSAFDQACLWLER